MSKFALEEVLSVHHWNDTLFSFRTTRERSLRFKNGQFVMIGLEVDGKPLMRAYSIASPNYEDHLEFFSIKVPDGPLTSRLQHLKVGDQIMVSRKPTGTLVCDDLLPGRNLYMLSTGTGLAPFMSLIQDPEIYERFEKWCWYMACVKSLSWPTPTSSPKSCPPTSTWAKRSPRSWCTTPR
ncbi:hypothetical protein HAALTHF_12100n [Vreelandella aquamarina]|nr:hypothetical protein HAALTHF_12100n [Halomonas axialensis]